MDGYPLLNLFLTMMYLFLWVIWFTLLFRVIADIFRDDGLNGWAKAAWTVFVIVLPFLGVFVYLVARGRGMGGREAARTRELEARHLATAGSAGHAEELARLAELKEHGALTAEEYQRAKDKVLAA
ncbi:SHOCT domain-containing protein [Thermomonospora catenispora]|uniref:SHOCT domain-containing protein n=1 Tax=Thermomonospora catenispora TaxID=2493090 RepID=UPI00111EDA1B|nr:SHOCT domain-containing protein [Thermomonospora catenispora]TNY35374.1 SHOCT domain-containing protein [Thermomonospora catenispora]